MENYINIKLILDALIFSVIGMVVFGFAAWFVEWITPFNLWDEIVKGKNTALAIQNSSVQAYKYQVKFLTKRLNDPTELDTFLTQTLKSIHTSMTIKSLFYT